MEPLSTETIMATATYKNLILKKENIAAKLLLRRDVRERISNALRVYRHSKEIPSHVSSHSLKVVLDLIDKDKAGN